MQLVIIFFIYNGIIFFSIILIKRQYFLRNIININLDLPSLQKYKFIKNVIISAFVK